MAKLRGHTPETKALIGKMLELRYKEQASFKEIGQRLGVSKQYVSSLIGGDCYERRHKPKTAEQVVFPAIRDWMNKNEVTTMALSAMLGYADGNQTFANVGKILKGERDPSKRVIDRLIELTGRPYEEVFKRD